MRSERAPEGGTLRYPGVGDPSASTSCRRASPWRPPSATSRATNRPCSRWWVSVATTSKALGPDLARRPLFMPGRPVEVRAQYGAARDGPDVAESARRGRDHRPSPLAVAGPARGFGRQRVVTDSELSSDVLADLVPDEGPFVLAVDDAEMHKETPAAAWLKTYIRTTTDTRRALLVAGTASDLSGGFTGWRGGAQGPNRRAAVSSGCIRGRTRRRPSPAQCRRRAGQAREGAAPPR